MRIGRLDAPINDIYYYPLMPPKEVWELYVGNRDPFPAFVMDREDRCMVLNNDYIDTEPDDMAADGLSVSAKGTGIRLNYSVDLIGGSSGDLTAILTKDGLVIKGVHTYAPYGTGPSVAHFSAHIHSSVASLRAGTDYSNDFDMSGYTPL